MASITLADIREQLYLIGVKFDRLPQRTRIALALCYVLIIILCAILNGAYLYVFLAKAKLKKPSNLIASGLLWNSMLLLLTVLPLILLQICTDDVAKNHNVVSVQNYITLSYVWLSFSTVVHIGANRFRKIRSGIANLDEEKYLGEITFLVAGAISSALMPLTTITILFYYSMRAAQIYSFAQFIIMMLILLVSYVAILRQVKKSNDRLNGLQRNAHLLQQQEKILRKVKKTVSLVIGGYVLTLIPLTCSCAAEIYSVYNTAFRRDHEVFLYTFRGVGEMIMYMNSIFNPIIYFYTNPEVQEEAEKLYVIKQTITTLKSLKFL